MSADRLRKSYKTFYEEIYPFQYDPHNENGRKIFYCDDRFANIRDFVLEEGSGKVILDVGCGNGWVSSLYKEGNSVVGLELSQRMIEKALSRGLRIVRHNLEEDFPFRDASFDLVVCSEVLEHLFIPEWVLKECNRILKPMGKLIVTVPNLFCLRNRREILFGRPSRFLEYPHDPGHIRFYSRRSMSYFLPLAGFRVMKVRGQSFSLNFGFLKRLFYFMHGGNRGLRFVLKMLSGGRIQEPQPGYRLRFYLERICGDLFPSLSPGLIFKCEKLGPPSEEFDRFFRERGRRKL